VVRIDSARALSSSIRPRKTPACSAARALAIQLNAISLTINGETRQGAFHVACADDLARRPRINRGEGNARPCCP
jgi:hypothetical protein